MANPEFARTLPDVPAESEATIRELTGPTTKPERSLIKPRPERARLAESPEAKVEENVLVAALDRINDQVAPLEERFYAPVTKENWAAREAVVLDTLHKVADLNQNFLGFLESAFVPELATPELIKKVHDTAFRTHQLEVRLNAEARNYLSRYSPSPSEIKAEGDRIEALRKKIAVEQAAVNPADVFASPEGTPLPKGGGDTDIGAPALKEMRGELATGKIGLPDKTVSEEAPTEVIDAQQYIPTQTMAEISTPTEEPTLSEKEIPTVVAETPTIVEPQTVVEEARTMVDQA